MKIHKARHYGMCFGVTDAIELAKEKSRETPVTMLGELAHNADVVQDLKDHGVNQGKLDDLKSSGTKDVLITAHGASDHAINEWKAAGFNVHNTTCPLVHRAHKQLRKLVNQGYHPVIIGQQGHVEVNGLAGDFPECSIMLKSEDIETLPLNTKLGVISQTTQPIAKVQDLVTLIQIHRPNQEVRFVDTVCQPTKDRQEALNELIHKVELMIVVGGSNSNNTRQLAVKSRQKGVPAHHIQSAEQLQFEWFDGVEVVGLTAGTSTPHILVDSVYEALTRLAELKEMYKEKAGKGSFHQGVAA